MPTPEEHAIDVVGRLYAALACGDRVAVTGLLDPGFVGRTAEGMPLGTGGTFEGVESMIDDVWWRLGSAFSVRAEPETFALVDPVRLHVTGTYRGRARSTGRPLDARFVHVWSLDGERVTGVEQVTDTAAWHAALEGAAHPVPAFPGPAPADFQTIGYRVEDQVARLTLARPDARNAIDLQMGEEVLGAARAIAADPGVRSVLIAGEGQVLTVGGDIDSFLRSPRGALGDLTARMTEPFHEALRILSRIDAPIVTAAHGSVAGGGLAFVYAADIVLAARGTVFTTVFAGIGMSGDGGGTWHLPRLIGAARARRMYLENLRIDADQALEWGLVAEVVPPDELSDRALALARRLAGGPTKAFGWQRRLLRDTWGASLSDQLRAETEGIRATGGTADVGGAIRAFAEKRRPTFEGR